MVASWPGTLFRLAVAGEIEAAIEEGRHVSEDLVLFLPVSEVAEVDDVLIGTTALSLFPHEHEPFGIRVRKAAQQHRIDDAEDRSVRADTERERKQRHKRHHRALQKHPHAKLNISKYLFIYSASTLDRRQSV